jgi:putative ABC transport system permease protein
MSLFGFAKKSLGFYWRTNLGVFLAIMVSTAVLVGALIVGDSVRYSLRRMVTARLGKTQLALVPQGRFFRDKLADDLQSELNTIIAPVLQVRGMITDGNSEKRANRIEVLGVDHRFYKIGSAPNLFDDNWSEGIVLNEPLAAKLGIGPGDEVVLRIEKPGLMPRDIPLTPDSDLSTAFRLSVKAIAQESDFGRFSLQANQVAPLNAFVPLEWLQEKIARSKQASMLLVAMEENGTPTKEKADEAIGKCYRLADMDVELKRLDRLSVFEIRSKRVFIDEVLAKAAMDMENKAVGILTYFVNELRLGDKMTPYSMVTAMSRSENANSIIPADMQDGEILINQWLADDLSAKVGDSIELTYFTLGRMRRLQEQTSSFCIRGILPMKGPAVDPNLMPDFPGLANVENCRDWDPGIPIDLDKIRQRDENYWDNYSGTPKAFVTLGAGQKMWANRYGNLTAVRYPVGDNTAEDIAGKLLSEVDPASVGLFFQPVRARGIKAGDQATDFGQLFLGLSMFLIISALILMGLLFVFGIENRTEQVGMLLAVGFPPGLVRRLLLIEGLILSILGAIIGIAVALVYTQIMIYGLATIWSAAITGSTIHFYAKPSTLIIGWLAAVAICIFAIWLTVRKQVSRPARELLAGVMNWQFFAKRRTFFIHRIGLWVAIAASVGAATLLAMARTGKSSAVSGAFFGAGALLLIAGLGLAQTLLKIISGNQNRHSGTISSIAGLGLKNTTRRSGRSLAVTGLLACGIFLVIAIGANRHDPLADAQNRDSGTGGFALYGESSIGILHDLNSKSGLQSMSLDNSMINGSEFVQLRVHDGDDASCLNLNRAQRPRLLGVQPYQLQIRGAFGFTDLIEGADKENAWNLLERDLGTDVIPAVGDYATVYWALGKSVGDELEYTDEKGREFRLCIVGMLRNSILQGSLLISEDNFIRLFPSEDGYRVMLIDASQQMTKKVAESLSSSLRNYGLTLTPTTERLATFSAVESTYLSIFQLLGGLGLILGSVGLGLVVLRNVLERRGELAMMRAVGFNKVMLKKMIFHEHSGLMLYGLVCGIVAALVAVSPALKSPGAQVPYLSLTLTILTIGISGIAWIWISTALALSGELLDALRNE